MYFRPLKFQMVSFMVICLGSIECASSWCIHQLKNISKIADMCMCASKQANIKRHLGQPWHQK